jgi:O-succinylbenzoic acid--CoA ligase
MKVLPHLEASTIDDGRLRVRGASMLTGYVSLGLDRGPHFWDPKDEDGWFVSDDYGTVSEGTLRVEGRISDRLNIGGEITDLRMLLALIHTNSVGLVDPNHCALLAVPDPRLEWVVGFVSESVVDAKDVATFVERFNAAVLPFERIRKQFVVDRIPRTELGKVKRAELLALVSSP